MKQVLTKTKSQLLFENNLKRSLKILDIPVDQTFNSSQKLLKTIENSSKDLKNSHKSSKSLKSCKSSKSSVSLERKQTDLPEELPINQEENLLKEKIWLKKQKIKEKTNILKSKEEAVKNLELKVRKMEKELRKKEREAEIYKSASRRMVAECISKGIIEDLIWHVMFRSLTHKQINLSSRKNACLSALAKMKKVVSKIESTKRVLEDQVGLINTQNP